MLAQRCISLTLLAVLAVLAAPCYGKTFSRCDLAKELVKKGIPRNQINDWVCLVEAESARNTAAVGRPNKNGSRDYGLFQINDRYWCTKSGPAGKDCNIRCSDLTNDNISDDVQCAKKVYKRHGFSAWYGWRNRCKGRTLPNAASCL